MSNRSTVVGVFSDRAQAERAVEDLRRAGFRDDQIGVAVRDGDRTGTMADAGDRGANTAGGAATGAVLGGILGAAAALLIPGIGPVLAIGTLGGTVLAGAAAGAGIGALAGALIGMGVPEEEARYYEGEFQQGRTIVTVNAANRYAEAQDILRRNGAYDMQSRGTAAPQQSARPMAATAGQAGTATVDVREEQLRAQKQQVQAGEVAIKKDVVEERKSFEVPVTKEEVRVERTPVEPRPTDKPVGADDETVRVPVMEERVTVEKRPVVTEQVTVSKTPVTETREVSGTVRKEEVHVDKGAGQTYEWAQCSPSFRQDWQSRYGGKGRWEEYEPYYRFGYDAAMNPRYKGRQWNEVQGDLSRDFASRYPGQNWDVASNPIKHAWDHVTATPHTHA